MTTERQRSRMRRRRRATVTGAAVVVAALLAAPVAMAGPDTNAHGSGDQHTHQAGNGDDGNWVSAWSASPQGPSTLGKFGIETLSGDSQVQIAQQIVPPPTAFSDETIRQVMYLHHGGSAVRIQVANDYGTGDTTIPSVTVGKRAGDSGAAVEGEPLPVTFGGKESVTIPKGERVLSDPVPLTTEALQHVVVSMFVPGGQGPATVHGNAMQTFFTSAGDQTDATDDGAFAERGIVNNRYTSTFTTATYYATSIQVEGEPGDKTIVALGDSITDGFFSEGNTDGRYPDVLARRLKANPETAHLSVTNQAISAGRVLRDDVGPSTLNRLENDVLNQPNLGGVLFLQGINDIGNTLFQDRPRTADELIEGYKELAERVHAAGVPIYIGTLTPAGNLARPTPFGMYSLPGPVAERNKVNEWLRTEGTQYFDGIVDHDKTIRDPLVPDWIALQYDALDNLHPNQLGYKTMAETIPQEYLDEMAG